MKSVPVREPSLSLAAALDLETPGDFFRRRLIHLRTMEPALRTVTLIAVCVLILSAVLLALRDQPLPLTAVTAGSYDANLPSITYLLTVIFLALTWSYFLAGSLHAHLVIRVVGLAFFTLFVLWLPSPANFAPGFRSPPTLVALAAIWLLAILLWVRDVSRGQPLSGGHHQRRLHTPTTALVTLLVLAVFGTAALTDDPTRAAEPFSQLLFRHLNLLSFALSPILLLTGIDFAEWGEHLGGQLALTLGRWRQPLVLPMITLVIAVAILVKLVLQAGWRSFLPSFPLILLGTALVLIVGRASRVMVDLKRAVIPLGITAAAALLLTLLPDVLYNVVGIAGPISQKTVVGVGLVTYTRAEPPPFSLEYPPLWTVEPPYGEYPQDPRVVAFNGMSTSDRASFVVVAVSLRQYSRYRKFPQLVVGDFLCGDGECQAQLGTTEVRGQWELGQFTQTFTDPPDVVHGVAWWRQQGDSIWLLYGFRHEAVEPMAPLFQGMVDSWQPDARFTPSPPTAREVGIDERNFAVTGFVLLFAAFGAAISLVRARRARRPPSTAALFLFVTGVVVSLRYFDLEIRSVAGVLGFPERSIQLPHLSLSDLQAWVAFGTIVFLGWLFVRSRHTFKMAVFVVMLLVLNSGLQVVAWISGLYGAAQDVEGRFSIAQAVVVLLALLWDLSLSGQSFTNVRTRVLPRHSAVMLYLAYLLLVATEILYWSSLRSSQPIPNSFESDQWPALGLLYLGIPYLICWFVLRLGRWSALQAEARSSPTRN